MSKIIAFCFAFFFAYFISLSSVFALAQFSTDYSINYSVDATGSTKVIFDIAQKNNLSTVYATSFSLSLTQTNLRNIKVSDSSGPLKFEAKKTDNITNISFDFANKVVGKDKINRFKIEYETDDIATPIGSVWEINIPKLEPNENTNSIQINLSVPNIFGSPAYIDPKPFKTSNSVYSFNSGNLGNKSISAVFGREQYYKLNLIYNLENTNNQTGEARISLLPDTSYQTSYIKGIDPKPIKVEADTDGNWLATYLVDPKSTLQVTAEIYVKLNFEPKASELKNEADYLKSNANWDTTSSVIEERALTNLTNPKSIYDFVVNHLQYNYAKISAPIGSNKRLGAIYALTNPSQAICTEYTDLFITLARRAKIPAREIQGYAISTNDRLKPLSLEKDILHAWPEYYDKQRSAWIQIDPTWSDTTGGIDYFTKLDLNHIAFVIHGQNPNLPLPAGAYKAANSASKDVYVEAIERLDFPTADLSANFLSQEKDHVNILITNNSGVSSIVNISATSDESFVTTSGKIAIPPFGQKTYSVSLIKHPWIFPKSGKLIIDLNGTPKEIRITIKPRLYSSYLAIFVGLGAFSSAFTAWRLYLRRKKSKAPIHW